MWQGSSQDSGRQGGAPSLLPKRGVARQQPGFRKTGRCYLSPPYTGCGKAAARIQGDRVGLPLSSLYRVWQGSSQYSGRRGGATSLLPIRGVAMQQPGFRETGRGSLSPPYKGCGKAAARIQGDRAGLPLSSLYGVWQGSSQDSGRRGGAPSLLPIQGVERQQQGFRETGWGFLSPPYTGCGKAAARIQGDRVGLPLSSLYGVCKAAARIQGDRAGLPLSSLYGVWQGSSQDSGRRGGAPSLLPIWGVARQQPGFRETGRGSLSPPYTGCGKAAARIQGDRAGLPLSSLYGVWQGSSQDSGRRRVYLSPISMGCGKVAARIQGDRVGLPLSSLYRVWQGSSQDSGRQGGAPSLLPKRGVARQQPGFRETGWGSLSPPYTGSGKAAARIQGDRAGLPLSSLYGVWQGSSQDSGRQGGAPPLLPKRGVARQQPGFRETGRGSLSPPYTGCGKAAARIQGDRAWAPSLLSLYGVWQGSSQDSGGQGGATSLLSLWGVARSGRPSVE